MHPNKKMKVLASAIVMDEVSLPLFNSSLIICGIMSIQDIQYIPLLYWLPSVVQDVSNRRPLLQEQWIEKYIQTDFYKLFRMSRDTCEKLNGAIGSIKKIGSGHGKAAVPLDKCILMTLWYLGQGDTLFSIANRFNVSPSTATERIHFVIDGMVELLPKFITWPTERECDEISIAFQEKCKYPGVIGAIDVCHICCKVPANQQDSYLDRKFNHSIILQAVCTSSCILTNVSLGFPGSISAARVLGESALGCAIERDGPEDWFYSNKYHLIGESAYPLRTWLMKPFRDAGNLTTQQILHNFCLSTGRISIEDVFGLLKTRWPILKYINVYSIECATSIVAAACMLHNFCLMAGDNFNMTADEIYKEDYPHEECSELEAEASNKRSQICNSVII